MNLGELRSVPCGPRSLWESCDSYRVLALCETCPISTMAYGGIPGGGGYSSHTEFEIGAQRAAEAAHCVLGSLARAHSWAEWMKKKGGADLAGWRGEIGHIKEEVALITSVHREYSRPLYSVRMTDGYYQEEDAKTSVDSIRRASAKLAVLAKQLRPQVDSGYPALDAMARAAYDYLEKLASFMQAAVKRWPEFVINPFDHPALRVEVGMLKGLIPDLEAAQRRGL
jgi:hypothetical protein